MCGSYLYWQWRNWCHFNRDIQSDLLLGSDKFISILQQQQPSILNPLTAHRPLTDPGRTTNTVSQYWSLQLLSGLLSLLCILLSVWSGLVCPGSGAQNNLWKCLDRGSDHRDHHRPIFTQQSPVTSWRVGSFLLPLSSLHNYIQTKH